MSRDLLANAIGNAWVALVQLAFIPVYIDLLGAESFGLIGLYGVLQVGVLVLDLGLTPTMSREASLVRAGTRAAPQARVLLRSLEWVVATVALAVAVAGISSAAWVSTAWLKLDDVAPRSAIHAIDLMGVLVALRLLFGIHRGVILGSEQFVWYNLAAASFATLRGAGVIPVLWWSPTIEAFFGQQVAVTVIEAFVMRRKAWSLLAGEGGPPTFSRDAIRAAGGFASGVAVLAAAMVFLGQVDKIVMSSILPLAEFAFYALAGSLAASLSLFLAPVGAVAYPRMNAVAARGDVAATTETFRELAQFTAVSVAPAACVLAGFATPLVFLWTGDPVVASGVGPLLAVMAAGTALGSFLYMPILLHMASGRSARLATSAAALAAVYVPSVYWAGTAHGAIGAAYAGLALNAGAVALFLALPQNTLASATRWRWLAVDTALPVLASLAVVVPAALLLSHSARTRGIGLAGSIALVGMAALVAAGAAAPAVRARLHAAWRAHP